MYGDEGAEYLHVPYHPKKTWPLPSTYCRLDCTRRTFWGVNGPTARFIKTTAFFWIEYHPAFVLSPRAALAGFYIPRLQPRLGVNNDSWEAECPPVTPITPLQWSINLPVLFQNTLVKAMMHWNATLREAIGSVQHQN
jgi:hypothetical protein